MEFDRKSSFRTIFLNTPGAGEVSSNKGLKQIAFQCNPSSPQITVYFVPQSFPSHTLLRNSSNDSYGNHNMSKSIHMPLHTNSELFHY